MDDSQHWLTSSIQWLLLPPGEPPPENGDQNALLSPSVTTQTTATMRFGIFYEHQLPRPWEPDDEHRLLTDALEQVELADRLGFDYLWEVEHHSL